VVGRGRQVLFEARTGDCKNDYPIEASRLEATVADEPDGAFARAGRAPRATASSGAPTAPASGTCGWRSWDLEPGRGRS